MMLYGYKLNKIYGSAQSDGKFNHISGLFKSFHKKDCVNVGISIAQTVDG